MITQAIKKVTKKSENRIKISENCKIGINKEEQIANSKNFPS